MREYFILLLDCEVPVQATLDVKHTEMVRLTSTEFPEITFQINPIDLFEDTQWAYEIGRIHAQITEQVKNKKLPGDKI